jgi:hypothetical protein
VSGSSVSTNSAAPGGGVRRIAGLATRMREVSASDLAGANRDQWRRSRLLSALGTAVGGAGVGLPRAALAGVRPGPRLFFGIGDTFPPGATIGGVPPVARERA